MIQLGVYQDLEVKKQTDFGVYLGELGENESQTILLPKKEVPKDTIKGSIINVFVYKDSEDREIATTAKVPLTLKSLAVLPVKEVNKVGAFLSWGLLKDLLLPHKEQTIKVHEGMNVLVSLYVDKSKRLCATMKVYELLQTDSPYSVDDSVTGIVYDYLDAFGAFVAVDNKFSALIPKREIFNKINIGDRITARVLEVREDGKLTISTRQKAYLQMDQDTQIVVDKLEENNGFLPYHDKSDAEEIKEVFMLSKNAFKRAIGRLYKSGTIEIRDNGIYLITKK